MNHTFTRDGLSTLACAAITFLCAFFLMLAGVAIWLFINIFVIGTLPAAAQTQPLKPAAYLSTIASNYAAPLTSSCNSEDNNCDRR